jgi:hypothetical protein
VQPIVEEVFGGKVPANGVRVIQPDYPPGRLHSWYQEVQDAIWPVGSVQSSTLDERQGRIKFGVQTAYAAYKARKALTRTGVPQEAVVIEVASKRTLDDPPEQEDSPIGVGISLDSPSKVQVGQLVPIEVVLTNNGAERVSFVYNPHHPMNVMVFTGDGEQVWAKQRGGLITAPANEANLAPNEELRFQVYWDLTDQDGFALPPGRYLVRGTSGIHDHVNGRIRPMDLATGPYELVIEVAEE